MKVTRYAKCLIVTAMLVSLVLVKLSHLPAEEMEIRKLKDLDCGVRFAAAHSLPPVALVSCAGSGNTWLRHLIELATGIYTGSMYNDKVLYGGGFLGEFEEWDSGTTVVVKTHTRSKEHILRFSAAILLLRNPYGAIASEVNRRFGGHTALEEWTDDFVRSTAFSDTVTKVIDNWELTVRNIFDNFHRPLLVVYYENLKQDPKEELTRIANFLNITIDEDRLLCVERDTSGDFKRAITSDNRRKQYRFIDEQQNVNIPESIRRVNGMLSNRGYKQVGQDEL